VIVYVTVIRLLEYTPGRILQATLISNFWLGDEPGGVGDIVFGLVERIEKCLDFSAVQAEAKVMNDC
jgi:hypothetical protein